MMPDWKAYTKEELVEAVNNANAEHGWRPTFHVHVLNTVETLFESVHFEGPGTVECGPHWIKLYYWTEVDHIKEETHCVTIEMRDDKVERREKGLSKTPPPKSLN
jgi:hypothetical protein